MSARSILIVIDDEPLLARAISRMVADDFEVRLYATGHDALEALQDADADVAVLCDMHLPDMTGMGIFAELSSLRPDLAERILFMTGSSTEPKMDKFLEDQRDRVLYKPFARAALLAALAAMGC